MYNTHLNKFKSLIDRGMSPELASVYNVAAQEFFRINSLIRSGIYSTATIDKAYEEGKRKVIAERDRIYQEKADAASLKLESIKAKYSKQPTDEEITRKALLLNQFKDKLEFKGTSYAKELLDKYLSNESNMPIEELYALGSFLNKNNEVWASILLSTMEERNADDPIRNDTEYLEAEREYNSAVMEIGNATIIFETGSGGEMLLIEQLLE